jgi:Golgi nucleoside diphosphatase
MTKDAASKKHYLEDEDSWLGHVERQKQRHRGHHRRLKHHDDSMTQTQVDEQFERLSAARERASYQQRLEWRHEHDLLLQQWQSTRFDLGRDTVHGILIDAGSTGSRLHIYEWIPRVLDQAQVTQAAAGNMLSFPGSDNRWTDRLRPGLADFAALPDEELAPALASYFEPLLDFARTVLQSKRDQWSTFPLYLRATAGLRLLEPLQQVRLVNAVRTLFTNATYSPFFAPDEAVRILSGEEEAIYDWASVNFVTGHLLQQSQGLGTVIVDPYTTHGALDLGGGSTQIAFVPAGEIMANLFKLQIGQGKHWNVYAHSFLGYGLNEARKRFQAKLLAAPPVQQHNTFSNPCLAEQAPPVLVRSRASWQDGVENATTPQHTAVLVGVPNVSACFAQVQSLLHLETNAWCQYVHQNQCSFAGIYQPSLPHTNHTSRHNHTGEFVAFSNYYHVWKFLRLPERATVAQLEQATRHVCSLTHAQLQDWAADTDDEDDVVSDYCFRAAYVYQMLSAGYGFSPGDTIRAVKVVHGQKVGWALGAMLYEINTLPWQYQSNSDPVVVDWSHQYVALVLVGLVVALVLVLVRRRRTVPHEAMNHDETRPLTLKYTKYESMEDGKRSPRSTTDLLMA